MSTTASFDRFAPPNGRDDAVVVAKCGCGCDGEIVEGYDHVLYDGEWFYDDDCVLRYLGAERKAAG